MKVSKGMPLLAAIAAVMVVSYTIFRLNYAANHLPYDPGDAYPTVEVAPDQSGSVESRVREAFLSKHSVLLVGNQPEASQDAPAKSALRQAWPLRGLERERALLSLKQLIADAYGHLQEQPSTANCERLAACVAAGKLVERDRVFVVEGVVPELRSNGGWHDWNLALFETKDRVRVMYAPIEAQAFDFVRQAKTDDPKSFDPR